MSDKGYERYLQNMVKQEHELTHGLAIQLEQQRQKNGKLLNQLSSLRKKQNDNKLQIKQLLERVSQLEMELQARKNPHPKRPAIDKSNIAKRTSILEDASLDRKLVFKQFITDNYPKYKDVVKKALALILHVQRHSNKNPKQRIDTYYEIWGDLMRKFLNFFIGKKSENEKNQSIAERMVQKWKTSENKMKQLMTERNILKNKQDNYLQQIQRLQASEIRLIANKKAMQSKIFAYQAALQMKGAQFVVHLKKSFINPEQMSEEQIKKLEKIMQTMHELSQRKSIKQEPQKDIENVSNKNIRNNQQSEKNSQNILKQTMRASSGAKFRKNAPVLKKNIYGYYENPQLNNNQPNLSLIKHPNLNKAIQTIPQDLSIMTVRPVIMLTVVDGNIKPQRSRHCLNFYVNINYDFENKLFLSSKLSMNSLQPVWNDPFLIYGYKFPFFTLDVMSQSKGLKDYSIGDGRIQVTRTQMPKYVNIKNDGQHQGRVRFTLTYPKGRIYLFKINSVKLVYPQNFPLGKDTLNIKVSLNPNIQINFEIGQKIKYFDDDYKGNNKFLILDGFDGDIKVGYQKIGKKGSIPLAQVAEKQGQKQIQILVDRGWSVILQGVMLIIVSQQQQPQKIPQQEFELQKYFSIISEPSTTQVVYNSISIPHHIKLPLVFKFKDEINELKLLKKEIKQDKKNRKSKNKQDMGEIFQEIITPIVIPHTNVICGEHKDSGNRRLLRAPKLIYQIIIQMIEGNVAVTLSTQQKYFQKILSDVQLKCGQKQFSIAGKDLLQNYYIPISRTFKDIGYTRFKIGYIVHKNLLKQKLEGEDQNGIQKIVDKELQVLDTGEYYITCLLSTCFLKQYTSTGDYQIIFEFGNCNSTQRKSGNVLLFNESFVLPYIKQINMKIQQFTIVGQKIIYESKIIFTEKNLKLGCKYVNFGQNSSSFIYFSKICNVKEVYSVKIQKMSAELPNNEDWIGQMDPYIKFNSMNRQIYCTQKLQSAGVRPVWVNDQFVTLTNSNLINLKLYDDDLIGKDDYLGQCTLQIPEKPTKILQYKLNKQKYPQKQCGKIVLNGNFNKLTNISQYVPKQHKINIPQLVYKITIYRLDINKKYIGDSDLAYLTYRFDDQNEESNFMIQSGKFYRGGRTRHDIDEQGNKDGGIYIDFVIWVKNPTQNNLTLALTKIVKNLFSTKEQGLASIIIPKQTLSSKIVTKNSSQILLCNTQTYIGDLSYITQPVSSTRLMWIENLDYYLGEELVVVSDNGDCIGLFGSKQEKNQGKLLAYDQKFYILTHEQYKKSLEIDKYKENKKYLNFCESQSKYDINWLDISSYNMVLPINLRNQKQKSKLFDTPKAVLLTKKIDFVRKVFPKSLNMSKKQKQKQEITLYKLNHLTIKNSSSKTCVFSQNTSLILQISWQDYKISIPLSIINNNNEWIPSNLLNLYKNKPISLQLIEITRQGYRQYQNMKVIMEQEFIDSTKNTLDNTVQSNSINKQYECEICHTSSYFKYNKNKYLLSCQFQKLASPSPLYKQLYQLVIPWLYISLPIANMNAIQTEEESSKNIEEQYQILHQVWIAWTGVDSNGIGVRFDSNIVIPIDNLSVLIQGRSIFTKQYILPFVESIRENSNGKLEVKTVQLKLKISKIYKRSKELKISQCIKTIQFSTLQISNIIRQANNKIGEKSIHGEYLFTNPYNNSDNHTFYGEYCLDRVRNSYKQNENLIECISNQLLIELEDIIVDINDDLNSYNVNQYQLYLFCINTKTQTIRTFPLEITSHKQKKYNLKQAQPYTKTLTIQDAGTCNYKLKVCAIADQGIMDRILNRQNQIEIGQALCLFDKWETLRMETVMLQLKQVQKNQKDGSVLSINSSSVGYIKIKYKSYKGEQIVNQSYRQLDIDRVVLQLNNANKNITQKLRIQCTPFFSQLQLQNEKIPFLTLYANLTHQKIGNLNKIFEYKLKQPIFISLEQNMWVNQYIVNVFDHRYNILLGSFKTNQPMKIVEDELRMLGQSNCVKYSRWSKELYINQLPTVILVGSVLQSLPFNEKLQGKTAKLQSPTKTKSAVQPLNQPSILQIQDKIGETIVQFTISNFCGMIQPKQGDNIYITIQTSLRIIRNMAIKYFKTANQETGKKQFTYKVFMYQKQLFNTKIIVNICNRKGQPIYSSQLLPANVGDVGFLIFHNPNQKQQIKQSSSKRMAVGSCIYTICLPYNKKIQKIQQMQIFLQLTSIQLKLYRDTELFSKMSPYLIINQQYSSSIGVGKNDIFWQLNLLLPLGHIDKNKNSANGEALKIGVFDQDMFFDDQIGFAQVQIPFFDIQLQLQQDVNQIISKNEHTVLKLQEQTHLSTDIKYKNNMAGRIKINYRYLSGLPVIMLYKEINTSEDKKFSFKVDKYINEIEDKLTMNIYKNRLTYENVLQEIVSVKVNKGNMGQFNDFYRSLMQGESQQKSIEVPCAQLCSINRTILQWLGVSQRQIVLYMTSKYIQAQLTNKNSYHWKLTSIQNKKEKVTKIEENPMYRPLSHLMGQQKVGIRYIQKLSLYIQKSKFNTVNYLLVYVMTEQSMVILSHNINAKLFMHGEDTYSQVIDIEPINCIIPVHKNRNQKQVCIKIIVYDQQTGYSCITYIKKSVEDQASINKKNNENNQVLLINSDSYNSYMKSLKYQDGYQEDNIENRANRFLILSSIYTTDKYQLESEYKNNIGTAYLTMNTIFSLNSKNSKTQLQKKQKNIPVTISFKNASRNLMLKINIGKAVMLKDIQVFSKMDPYCQVHIQHKNNTQNSQNSENTRIHKTKVQNNQGVLPIWNEQFYINVPIIQGNGILLEFLVKDEEVTKDRVIGYGVLDITKYLEECLKKDNGSNGQQYKQMVVNLAQTKDKSTKSGDLFIQLGSPISRYLIFTNLHTHTHRKQSNNVHIYYQQLPYILTQQEKSKQQQTKLTKIHGENMVKIKPGTVYPLGEEVLSLRIVVIWENTNKIFVKFMTVEEMYQRMEMGVSFINVVDAGVGLAYFICETDTYNDKTSTRRKEVIKNKFKEVKNQQTVNNEQIPKNKNFILQDNNQTKDNGIFILDGATQNKITNNQRGMFILQDPQSIKKQQQDEFSFLLGPTSIKAKGENNYKESNPKNQMIQKQKQISVDQKFKEKGLFILNQEEDKKQKVLNEKEITKQKQYSKNKIKSKRKL